MEVEEHRVMKQYTVHLLQEGFKEEMKGEEHSGLKQSAVILL